MIRQDLEALSAERDILRQLNNYCRGLDRFDVDLWKSVWHADATLDYESGQLKGEAMAMALQMTVGHEVFAAHSHQLLNPTIRVDGDHAVSETCANAVLRGYSDGSGHAIDSHYRGRYLDSWSRRDGRWAIDHRILLEELMWNQPMMEGRIGDRTRRDRDDPSYALFASLEPGETNGVELLKAERDIREQLHLSCWTLDLRDTEFRDAVAGRSSVHQPGTSLITVNGDRAVSETGVMIVLIGDPDDAGGAVAEHYRARYLDRWTRWEGRWLIECRDVVEDFMWQQPADRTRDGNSGIPAAQDSLHAMVASFG